jgi:signal transduction histidine kinase/ActR/RegA family two-component response regulator
LAATTESRYKNEVTSFVPERRVVAMLLAFQGMVVAALAAYLWLSGQSDYAPQCSAGALIFGCLWWVHRRGIDQARLVAVVLVAVLVAGSHEEPYLTGQPSFALLIPPVFAALLASWPWVVGVALFEVMALALVAGPDSVLLRPAELTLFALVVGALLLGRQLLHEALIAAKAARAEAERARQEAECARERAEDRAREALERGQRERLEGDSVHAQRLESVGRLAGGVAHDFNNLLTVISGSASLAQRALPPDHDAAGDIEEVLNAAKRAAELTRQLLAFARRQVLVKKVFDARDLLAGLERMLSRLVGEQLTLELQLTADPLPISADRGQIEQVIVNLVLNARDAMPEGGTVTISARRAPLPGAPESSPDYVRLDVRDTGAGMSADVKDRVFEPFFTTKELGRGTGLGLATSFGIVTQHDGQLLLDSSPGRGSAFSVYLPAAESVVDENSKSIVRTLPRGSERVLLVEDDPHVRAVAERVLQAAGYGVQTASGGREALAYLEASGYDVLVTDVVMPGINGVELAGRALALQPKLGVVLMSGYANALVDTSLEFARAPEFVQKPFSPRQLVQGVQQALTRTSVVGLG